MKTEILVTALCLILLMSAIAIAQSNPVPIIFKPLVPGAVAPGSAGFTLTVNGANFVRGAVVKWNGHARSTRFISSTKLQANIFASDVAFGGSTSVTVLNPGRRVSNEGLFSVTEPSPAVSFAVNTLIVPMDEAIGITAGDWNSDGKMDLVVQGQSGFATGSGIVASYLGNGDGTMQLHQTKTFRDSSLAIRAGVGDLNGDGKLDLIVPLRFLQLVRGTGDGTFLASGALLPTVIDVYDIAVADFNKDGFVDLASNPFIGNLGTIAIQLGQGGFAFAPAVLYEEGINALDLATGDFNSDGNLDIAVTGTFLDFLSVFIGKGDGTFRPAYSVPSGHVSFTIDAGDVNGDGILDLVTTDIYVNQVAVLLGKGDGTFQLPVEYATGSLPHPVVLADVNGDSIPDLVTGTDGALSVNLGRGDGTFDSFISVPTGATAGALTVADFNGDGRLDIGEANGDNSISILLQTSQ